MHQVFVYGTLKRGFPYHDSGLRGQRFVGRFRTRVPYPLVVGGRWYSPILIAEPGNGVRVRGEVYAVGDRALARLDEMEGAGLPGGYDRIRIAVEHLRGGAAREAWAYVKARAAIDVVHSEPMAEYHLDWRYIPAAGRRP